LCSLCSFKAIDEQKRIVQQTKEEMMELRRDFMKEQDRMREILAGHKKNEEGRLQQLEVKEKEAESLVVQLRQEMMKQDRQDEMDRFFARQRENVDAFSDLLKHDRFVKRPLNFVSLLPTMSCFVLIALDASVCLILYHSIRLVDAQEAALRKASPKYPEDDGDDASSVYVPPRYPSRSYHGGSRASTLSVGVDDLYLRNAKRLSHLSKISSELGQAGKDTREIENLLEDFASTKRMYRRKQAQDIHPV
jgi:hypothetical protein